MKPRPVWIKSYLYCTGERRTMKCNLRYVYRFLGLEGAASPRQPLAGPLLPPDPTSSPDGPPTAPRSTTKRRSHDAAALHRPPSWVSPRFLLPARNPGHKS